MKNNFESIFNNPSSLNMEYAREIMDFITQDNYKVTSVCCNYEFNALDLYRLADALKEIANNLEYSNKIRDEY